jgi:hypothetical protein
LHHSELMMVTSCGGRGWATSTVSESEELVSRSDAATG